MVSQPGAFHGKYGLLLRLVKLKGARTVGTVVKRAGIFQGGLR
jgi:hypothetical protein